MKIKSIKDIKELKKFEEEIKEIWGSMIEEDIRKAIERGWIDKYGIYFYSYLDKSKTYIVRFK